MMGNFKGFRGNAGSKRATTQILSTCLLVAVMFLLLDVAYSSRSLPNPPEFDINSNSFQSSRSRGSTSERILLQSGVFGGPSSGDKSPSHAVDGSTPLSPPPP